jgi:hypothetical protein
VAVVFSEAYEGGTQGVAVTTSNTGWSSFSAAAQQTFDSTHAVTGTFSVNVALAANTAYSQKTFTAANVQYQRFYLWMDAATSAATLIARLLSGTTSRAEIRMNADRTLNVRNVTTVTGVATAALPLGEWVRVEWKVDGGAGTQELRAYWGADLHGSTPTTTVGAAAAFTNATFDTYRLGSQTAATWTVWYDDVALDSAAYPAPTGSASATVTGVTATSTTTAPAGSVFSSSELPGATATVTAAAPPGAATAGSTVAGVAASVAVSAPAGSPVAGGSVTVSGVIAAMSAAAAPGVMAASARPVGVTVTVTAGGLPGQVSAAMSAVGVPAAVSVTAPPGAVTVSLTASGVTALAAVAATGGTVSAGAGLAGVPALVSVSATAGSVPGVAVSGRTVIRRTDTPASIHDMSPPTAVGQSTRTARIGVALSPGSVHGSVR